MAGHLLPNFDEYTVAYRDRSAVVDPQAPIDAALFSFGSILSNIVTVEGRVRGAWRRSSTRAGLQVEISLLTPLGTAEISALEQAGRRLGRFLGRPVHLHGLRTRA